MGRVWLSVELQLYFGKQSILAEHPPFTWQKILTYSIKDSAGNILTDENEILSRCREYFKDFLNLVKASTRGIQEVMHLREKEVKLILVKCISDIFQKVSFSYFRIFGDRV